MKRIITAREQVQLLAAWRERSDGRQPFRYYQQNGPQHKANEGWDEYGHALYPDLPEYVRHFPYNESHVRYTVQPVRDDGVDYRGQKVYKDRGGAPPESWSIYHEGVWQGHLHRDKPDGSGQYDFTSPTYKRKKDGTQENIKDGGPAGTWTFFLGDFPTHEEAKSAAEAHFNKHYPQTRPDTDYYEKIINDLPDLNDDYGDIFGDKS